MRAVAYARVSTDAQVASGLGLEAQEAATRELAGRLGVELAASFRDEGLSGTTPLDRRPGLLDAIASLGKGDVLLVARRDRLGRDVVAVALIEREVARRGARVASAAGEGSELEGPTGKLVRTILDAVAAFELAAIALRTRAALRAKRARGERAGNVPFGFRAGEGGRLEPDPREVAARARIAELRAGGASLREVAAKLEEEGVRGRTGRPLTLRRVCVLSRRAAS